jgi:NTE family protein
MRSIALAHRIWVDIVLSRLTTLILTCALFLAPLPVAAANTTGIVTASEPHRPRVVLALGGGGTRGAAHVGVLRVLQRENIPIDGICGTSMGAIVGGLFCAGISVDQIEHDLLDKKQLLHAYNTVPIPVRVAAIPVFFVPHLFGYRPYDGLYKGTKFRNYLNDSVPETQRNIEDLKIPFGAIASSLVDGRAVTISSGNLGLAIQASSAIPFLRRPVPLGDRQLCVDGGITENLPVPEARAMGGDIVIAVDVDEDFHQSEDRTAYKHILTVPPRVISMLLTRIDADSQKQADVVIHPDVEGIHLLSTKIADGKRAINEGEKAAQSALPAIRAAIAKANLTTVSH